jgi:NADH-quinone oxidoreductase subunit M
LAQTDFKRMVAYSSVSHMGYVILGIAVWKISESAGVALGKDYWLMGMNGAMFQMIAHGISSAGMFFMVGVIYDRVHHRDLNQFGGLMGLMPLYSALAVGIFFAGLGLPGLCGFIGEIFVVLSSWILWAIQRVYVGAEYKGPHAEAITPINAREAAIGFSLLAFAIFLGVYPNFMLNIMHSSMDQLVTSLDTGYQHAVRAAGAAQALLDR